TELIALKYLIRTNALNPVELREANRPFALANANVKHILIKSNNWTEKYIFFCPLKWFSTKSLPFPKKCMQNLFSIKHLRKAAEAKLDPDAYLYLEGGSDDNETYGRNQRAFQLYQIRPRRLIDVRRVDTNANIFGKQWSSPIFLAPIGFQQLFTEEGVLATARAAANKNQLMIASTVTYHTYEAIADQFPDYKPWFQLYPTTNRTITKRLIQQAEMMGSEVLVITTDVPVVGNRENHAKIILSNTVGKNKQMGNLPDLGLDESFHDPGMTWDIIPWIRSFSQMKIVLKGIMTAEDAYLALDHQVDGIYISNHGGRQLESNLSTIECLEEIATAVNGQIPIFIDGGFRRGTDVFKALALGATAVGIGRPYIYGLSIHGQAGVEKALDIFQAELIRNMQLAGVINLAVLNQSYVRKAPFV
ncbi:MAG: alpha-hydroxy acid oxidase, partial [Bacteroidota bacterium]